MNSLKPTGDNIALEFYNILNKNNIEKTAAAAQHDSLTDAGSEERPDAGSKERDSLFGEILNSIPSGNRGRAEATGAFLGAILEDMENSNPDAQESDAMDHESNLEDMIMDDAYDVEGANKAMSMIDGALEAIENQAFDEPTVAEKRVLNGLSKIAAGLRSKGEGFAADVVLSTAQSIKGDIQKSAKERAFVNSSLNKIASELDQVGDQLSADMVRVTMSKIAGDYGDMEAEMEAQMMNMQNSGGSSDRSFKHLPSTDDLEEGFRKSNDRSNYAENAKKARGVLDKCLQEVKALEAQQGNAKDVKQRAKLAAKIGDTYSKYGVTVDSARKVYEVELKGPPEGQIVKFPMK